jgi:hypothetical protein
MTAVTYAEKLFDTLFLEALDKPNNISLFLLSRRAAQLRCI